MKCKADVSTVEDNMKNAVSKGISVNEAFELYNTFLNYAFKRKGTLKTSPRHISKQSKYSYAIEDQLKTKIVGIAKAMNINLSVSQISEKLFKNKEFANKIKEKMNRFVWSIINASNNLEVEPPETLPNGAFSQYWFKIGPGNNSFIIKRLMNERWWWSIYEKQSENVPHFRWTQWRKNNIIAQLKSNQQFNENFSQPSKYSKFYVVRPYRSRKWRD